MAFSNDTSDRDDDVSTAVLASLSSVLIISGLITTTVNIIIIITVFRNVALRNPAFILTTNIIVADLVFSLFVLPQYITSLIMKSTYSPFGFIFCYVEVYISNGTVATTVCFMAAIAVYRSVHVCYPQTYRNICTRRYMVLVCFVFWILPLIICAIFDNGVKYDIGKFVCTFSSYRYLYVLGALVYIPAFIVMPLAYGKVIYFVRQSRRRIEATVIIVSSGTASLQKDKHVFKLVLTIMIIFIISISVPNLFYSLSHGCVSCNKSITDLLGAWLVRLRPAMNFIAILTTCQFLRSTVKNQIRTCVTKQ